MPSPGYPASVHAHPNGRVYAGTYTNLRGTLLRSWTVPGQDLTVDRGVQLATSDARGRLVLLEKSTRRVITLNIRTGRFKEQARLPEGSLPNFATWGPRGALFVSDYAQPVIWRIPARGGQPREWFRAPGLAGIEFGTTGLVYDPDRRSFLISQQTTKDPLGRPTDASCSTSPAFPSPGTTAPPCPSTPRPTPPSSAPGCSS